MRRNNTLAEERCKSLLLNLLSTTNVLDVEDGDDIPRQLCYGKDKGVLVRIGHSCNQRLLYQRSIHLFLFAFKPMNGDKEKKT